MATLGRRLLSLAPKIGKAAGMIGPNGSRIAVTSQHGFLLDSCSRLRTAPLSSSSSLCQRKFKGHEIPREFSTSPAALLDDEESSSAIVNKISSRISSENMGRLFAVISINGKQRKITTEDIVVVKAHYPVEIGEKIRLNKVLMVGSKDFSLVGQPLLNANMVKVEATVIEKTLSYVRIHFNYIRRKNYKKLRPFQEPHTMLRITNIEITEPEDQM